MKWAHLLYINRHLGFIFTHNMSQPCTTQAGRVLLHRSGSFVLLLSTALPHRPYLLTTHRNIYIQPVYGTGCKKQRAKKGQMKSFSVQKLSKYKMGKMDFYPQMYFSPPCRWQGLYQGMGVLKERDEVQSSRFFPCLPELQRDQRKRDMNWLFWLMLVIRQGPGGSCMS